MAGGDGQTAEQVTVGVVGAGQMGRGIAQLFAANGHPVQLFDVADGAARAAHAAIQKGLDQRVQRGKLAAADASATLDRITVAESLQALSISGLVVEAVVEDLAVKRTLFAALEEIVSPSAILTSNTSSLSVTAIARDLNHPGRLAGLHFFNPAPVMRVVEVVRASRTDATVIDRLVGIVDRLGHKPVVAADTPGFIVNHAGRALTTEGIRLAADGVADTTTIDRIVTDTLGLRLGPFQFLDLVGLDVFEAVTRRMSDAYWGEPRFHAHPWVEQRVAAGLLGRKVDEGFYRYEGGKRIVPRESEVPQGPIRPAWVSQKGDREAANWLRSRLTAANVQLDDGVRPRAESTCLVLPIGDDATTAALDEHLPADQTVAVDPISCGTGRLTLMAAPGTPLSTLGSACALLGRVGVPLSVIADTHGFVAQRVAAMIVAVAAQMAQQRIAEPAAIDMAVTLGLGYPNGPFALGDRIGARRIARILDRAHAATGDPRYRPVPWITRRASLDLPLSTPDAGLT